MVGVFMPAAETFYQRDPAVQRERLTAGGVVVRPEGGFLKTALVLEQGIPGWVLPKGGVDPGESIADAALREIEEEAGLSRVEKLADLAVRERHDSEKKFWSIIHYGLFLTRQAEGRILDPEKHPGMAWFGLEELPAMFWPDECRLIEENRRRIYEIAIEYLNPALTGVSGAELP
jgi:8-oxo-dGTP pyrophosphatase MutT (NUDIX family)